VARDAIARLYDVEKNNVQLLILPGKGNYREGTITFQAKEGKSIDLAQMQASLQATRLSGGTRMGMDYLEITVAGEFVEDGKDLLLKTPGGGPQFLLRDNPTGERNLARRNTTQLRAALAKGPKPTSITGRVEGWNGVFPKVLQALGESSKRTKPEVLILIDFDTGKE
jgi:hypothetical protein